MNEDLERFFTLLQSATSRVDNPYFELPVDGQDLPVYRERVYAYELYHQLRTLWPYDWDYILNGEVDKRGHRLITGYPIHHTKPDLLVHRPGSMARNLIIVEIKSSNANPADIGQDLRKLNAFCSEAEYQKGIMLFFGQAERESLEQKCRNSFVYGHNRIDISNLVFFWQYQPCCAAERIDFLNRSSQHSH